MTLLTFCAAAWLSLSSASPSLTVLEPAGKDAPKGDGKLHLYFFDVGEGDACLLVSPTGRTVLVDAGPPQAGSHLAHRLPALTRGPIDLVLLTHPHDDHFGGLAQATSATGVSRFADVDMPQASAAHLRALPAKAVSLSPDSDRPAEPVRVALGGGAELVVLWPRAPLEAPLKGNPEHNSVVARVSLGTTSALLTGDARAETEGYLLSKRFDLSATLLKVAAHGRDIATTPAWLAAVKPQAAILSVGAGNALGAPAKAVLERLEGAGARIFRTDLDGEIHAVSDGKRFTLTTERLAAGETPGTAHLFPAKAAARPPKASPKVQEPPAAFVASKHGKVFHLPSCKAAQRIAPHNLIVYPSREEAEKSRRPAEDCKP
ncbi:MAG: ComEC/Rec2 family competence protein [Myxococcota bacterium]